MMKNKVLLAAISLYLASSASSFAMFSFFSPKSTISGDVQVIVNEDGELVIDPSEPRTEVCPLNGQKFTQTERAAWEQRRPLAVMIENSVDSRPQSGLANADIIYEAVAEGGITRFMAMFYCDAVAQDVLIAPVRSARSYFVDWASEYNRPIYAHVGGANCSADASGNCMSDPRTMSLEQIREYGWQLRNDIDGMSVGLPVFYRDYQRLGRDRRLATEHTMTTSSQRLWNEATKRRWTNTDPQGVEWSTGFTSWEFRDESDQVDRGAAQTVRYDFWSGYKQYDVSWRYNPETNTYARSMGGQPHMDLNNNQQLEFHNVIVILTDEIGPVDPLKHMLYTTIGRGEALIFNEGQAIQARWNKPSRVARTEFTDRAGREIKLVRGKTWISVINKNNTVAY